MNDQPDIERALRTWFDEGPTEMPDRVVDVVADRIGRQPQRHAWRLPWRLPMNPYMKLTAAVAAVVIVAVVGWNLLPRSGGIGGPAASPTPTPRISAGPSPSPSPCPTSDPDCIGLLEPGTHATAALITPVAFTVPSGWSKTLDVPGSVAIGLDDARFIGIWPDWNIARQDTCADPRPPEPGMGRTVDVLVAWVRQHDGLVTTDPLPVSFGGFDGQVLDVQLGPAWDGACGKSAYLFTHQGTINDVGGLDVRPTDRLRLYFVAVGDGHVVNVAIVASGDGVDFPAFLAEAVPVVESMTFE